MSRASPSTPRATYRLQLRDGMTFERAATLLPYLDALGVSHVYCSPCMEARTGSSHGYDVVDPTRIDPALGGEEAFVAFAEALRGRGMGLVLDWVPNHVGIANGENAWWQDVLEHGRASSYANFFDVDWETARPALRGKLLLPVLARHYGAVLEAGELELVWSESYGLEIHYFEQRFPVSPASTAAFLRERLLDRDTAPGLAEPQREALRGALARLEPAAGGARASKASAGKLALLDLVGGDPGLRAAVEAAVDSLGGRPGVPRSHDALHRLLERQHYRLSYWRVSAEEVNYRRFFDIDELAALRMDEPEVFTRTHERLLAAVQAGRIAGLRIDHVDGLADPRGYCGRLRKEAPGVYLVVEKILARDERLREDWAVDGTTGYEFLNQLGGLFVDPRAAGPLERLQRRFTGDSRSFDEILYESRKRVMHALLAGDLEGLASRLDRIAQQDRHTRDYTRSALRSALEEIVAWFPVYRTYVDERGASAEDRRRIQHAVHEARRRADDPESDLFDWIERILSGEVAAAASPARRSEVLRFVARFQQYTAPVMAKGLEDTSFYRHHRLVSLNEVGGDPRRFGTSVDEFHAANRDRAVHWPGAMLCTASHDTKRGEDARARIDVLSEMPDAWAEQVREWSRRNRRFKRTIDGKPAPSRKDEYLLYQVLVGAWPLPPAEARTLELYRERIQTFMKKALREGKERSSWRHPDAAYESSMAEFIAAILDPDGGFVEGARAFLDRVAERGRAERTGCHGAEAVLAGGARRLPGLRALGSLSRGSRQPEARRLRREADELSLPSSRSWAPSEPRRRRDGCASCCRPGRTLASSST